MAKKKATAPSAIPTSGASESATNAFARNKARTDKANNTVNKAGATAAKGRRSYTRGSESLGGAAGRLASPNNRARLSTGKNETTVKVGGKTLSVRRDKNGNVFSVRGKTAANAKPKGVSVTKGIGSKNVQRLAAARALMKTREAQGKIKGGSAKSAKGSRGGTKHDGK